MATDATRANRVGLQVQSKARFPQFLERRLGSRADAEDLLQTAFLKLVARENSLRDEEELIPWFYQLLRNLALRDTCGACADHGCLDCGCRRVTQP